MTSPSVSRVICLRHAEAEINVQRRFSSEIPGTPLTDLGREQAAATGLALVAEGVAHVYSSPLLRARQTAEIVGAAVNREVTVLDGLREVGLGAREGTPGTNTEFFQHPAFQAWIRGDDLAPSFEGGETGTDVVSRMRESLDAIADEHLGGTTAMVSHGGCLVAGLLHLCANLGYADVERGVPGNGTAIVVERRDGEWSCLSWPTVVHH
ncbi:histidine phosphatase family protein [Nocardioides sp.]|uniref:histidine phosphatase family protein n=1 Tax=Nocardioides sp. TaxID=35761 RepID=UPI002607D065|nr:histidine phosphatase family protein [Nocardioides sp.]MCW2736690.1 phosphoglycerate mutase [Nocardioides sp.]